jgi:hypothetical protein
MAIAKVDLSQAEESLGLANAPIFLMNRLRSDPSVQQISRENTANEILSALRASLRRRPSTLRSAVRPYVYLVALALTGDYTALRRASELDAAHLNWFKYIANLLMNSRPVNVQTFSMTNRAIKSEVKITSLSFHQSISKIA